MAHCDEYIELISAALDGALSPAQHKELEEHLASCPECAALSRELSILHAALEGLPPVEPPPELGGRIMEAVAAEKVIPFAPTAKKVSSPKRSWLASAAVLALVLLGTWSWKPWERNDLSRQPAPAAGTPALQAVPSAESGTVSPKSAVQDGGTENEIMPFANDGIALSPVDTPVPEETKEPVVSTATEKTVSPRSAAAAPTLFSSQDKDNEIASETEITPKENISPSLRMTPPQQTAPEAAAASTPEAAESGNTTAPALFAAPSSELAAEEAPSQSLTLQATSLPMPAGAVQPLTAEEALELTADYCFAGSGYNTVREDLEGDTPSAHFSLEEEGVSITGGTIAYTGEDETFFYFECRWDDDPEAPYHYSVHKLQHYVAWQGEAPIDGEFQP